MKRQKLAVRLLPDCYSRNSKIYSSPLNALRISAKLFLLVPLSLALGLTSPVAVAGDGGISHDAQPRIIFDTDIGPDYDDVGAVAMLHHFADEGKIKILATVASNKYEGIAGVLDVFNTYFHRPELPIGVPKGDGVTLGDPKHWTDAILAKYPHQVKHNSDVPDSVAVYRKVLAVQPDHSVTVVTVGFLTNLANLLDSPPDSVSPLKGRELVSKKVKLLISMAGAYPSGKEYNVEKDAAASKKAFETWPTPVIFSGFEIGSKIKTGLPLVQNEKIQNSPVKDAFKICMAKSPRDAKGRKSWDETAVLVAANGWNGYFSRHPGKVQIAPDGRDTWDDSAKGQYYLVEKMPPAEMESLINQLIMR